MIMQRLRSQGPAAGALGLGCSGMADALVGNYTDRESVAAIQAALDAGVSLLRAADFYSMGQSELRIGEAIYPNLQPPGGRNRQRIRRASWH